MHPFGAIDHRLQTPLGLCTVDLDPGRAEDPPLGNRHRHPVVAEIGKELGRGVKLGAVPARLPLEDGDLGKPLADEVEVTDETGARDDPRQLGFERDVDLDRVAGADLARQLHPGRAEVLRVSVVRPHELDLGQKIRPVIEGQAVDANPTPVATVHGPAAQRRAQQLTHEGGFGVGKGVEIEVKVELVGGHGGGVGPMDALVTLQAMGVRVEHYLD